MTTEPWRLLSADLHLHTLNTGYAPSSLLSMIDTPPGKVLDVGCFCGGSGKWLKTKYPGCEVVGVEPMCEAARRAADHYDKVFDVSFEKIDFEAEGINGGHFDTVILADVLEHLYNPWETLVKLKDLTAQSGAVYASIPNIGNLRIISGLAQGKWIYEGAGLLDVSHIRFFTRAQILEMFDQTGWKIEKIGSNPDHALTNGMFKGHDIAKINNIKVGRLTLSDLTKTEIEDLITLQFLVKAVPKR